MCRLVSWFCDMHEATYNLTLGKCKECREGAPCEKASVKTNEGWDENVVENMFTLKLIVRHRNCPTCVSKVHEDVHGDVRESDQEQEQVRQRAPRVREITKKRRTGYEGAFVRRKRDRHMGLLESLSGIMSGKW